MLKLCGMRRLQDIDIINKYRPDFMGMILSEGFRRSVDGNTADGLVSRLDRRIKKVGVFVDEDREKVCGYAHRLSLDAVQLHGHEDGDYIRALRSILPSGIAIWKAVRVRAAEDIAAADNYSCEYLLLDSFVRGSVGGTGVTADWDIIRHADIKTPFFLAGGITAANLREAMGVSDNIDISGGAETDGVKDGEKIRRITEIYRSPKGK